MPLTGTTIRNPAPVIPWIIHDAAATTCTICDESGDYANPIEPSVQGGAKIATAIARLASPDAWGGRSVVIVR